MVLRDFENVGCAAVLVGLVSESQMLFVYLTTNLRRRKAEQLQAKFGGKYSASVVAKVWAILRPIVQAGSLPSIRYSDPSLCTRSLFRDVVAVRNLAWCAVGGRRV